MSNRHNYFNTVMDDGDGGLVLWCGDAEKVTFDNYGLSIHRLRHRTFSLNILLYHQNIDNVIM